MGWTGPIYLSPDNALAAESSLALEAALRERMPERTLLGILARTAHWLEWHRRFAPASGSDPKLDDPLFRYVLTTFCYGTNMGPAQTARHITQPSPRTSCRSPPAGMSPSRS